MSVARLIIVLLTLGMASIAGFAADLQSSKTFAAWGKYLRILLWTIAFQGILMCALSPQADFVPNHLFAFALAPCLGVLVATVGQLPVLRVVGLFALTYVLALGVRVWCCFTPWWDYDIGFFVAIVIVPIPIAALIRRVHRVGADRSTHTQVDGKDFQKLLGEHRKRDAQRRLCLYSACHD